MSRYKSINVGYVIVIALFFILIAPQFLVRGMFMDGITYAAISKNMANGMGSFWNPYYTDCLFPSFHEHPALALYLESLFYRLLGNSMLVAKVYSCITYLISGYLIVLIWKEIMHDLKTGWLPLLLWIIIALVFWGATNNVLENTMTIFVLSSVLFYLYSVRKYRFRMIFLSGGMLFCAFMTKGFTGLYPLAFPFFYWIFNRERTFWQMVLDTVVLTLSMLLFFAVIVGLNPTARESMTAYFNNQVVNSIKNVRNTDSRFYIVVRFFMELLVSMAITLVIIVVGLYKRLINVADLKNNIGTVAMLFFFGLTGVVPMMISLKQSGMYALTVFPFYAILLAILSYSVIEKIHLSLKAKRITNIGCVLLITIALVMNACYAGQTTRDKDMFNDMDCFLTVLSEKDIVQVDNEIVSDFTFIAYMSYFKNISLDKESEHEFFIGNKGTKYNSNYEKIDFDTKLYDIYRNLNHNE